MPYRCSRSAMSFVCSALNLFSTTMGGLASRCAGDGECSGGQPNSMTEYDLQQEALKCSSMCDDHRAVPGWDAACELSRNPEQKPTIVLRKEWGEWSKKYLGDLVLTTNEEALAGLDVLTLQRQLEDGTWVAETRKLCEDLHRASIDFNDKWATDAQVSKAGARMEEDWGRIKLMRVGAKVAIGRWIEEIAQSEGGGKRRSGTRRKAAKFGRTTKKRKGAKKRTAKSQRVAACMCSGKRTKRRGVRRS